MAKVPLVPSRPLSEFGDFDPNELVSERPQGLERDGTYVPGFSEMRVARDMAVGQYQRGEITRDKIPTLPVNLRWARNQNKAGVPDNTKTFSHGRKGYKLVTKEDIGKPWLTEMPPGTVINADGTIRNGDNVLMVATARDAARNEFLRQKDTQEKLTGAIENSFAENLKKDGGTPRDVKDPTIEKTIITTKGK